MRKLGAAALLILAESSRDPDFACFAGKVHLGKCFLLVPRGGSPLLGYVVDMEREEAAATGFEILAPIAEEAAEARSRKATESGIELALVEAALDKVGLAKGVLALAGHPPAGRTHAIVEALGKRGFGFADGHGLVKALRKSKSAEEIAALRRAAEATCAAFWRVAEVLATAERSRSSLRLEGAPVTAGLLRHEIALALARHDLEQPEGNIVAAGADAGVPHTRGGDERLLEADEPIVVDLYPRGPLFADCTRTFCVGEAHPALRRAHASCSKALDRARADARPGVQGADLQSAVCQLFEDADYPTERSRPGTRVGYVHGLGHGVGYELHELPSFRRSAGEEGILEVGDVFTLEPGLYAPQEGWGIRLEDLFLMTADGPENLTPLPYDLDPAAW